MVDAAGQDIRGILHPAAGLEMFRLERFTPAGPAARFLDRYWMVSWDLPGGRDHEQTVLPHPAFQIAFDRGRAEVYGVQTGRFVRRLEGSGRALGVKFRHAGFRPFTDAPPAALTDEVRPLADFPQLADLADAALPMLDRGASGESVAAALDTAFADLVPARAHPSETTTAWAEHAAADRTLTRVEDLASALGVGVRTLQRAFRDHVGVGPKWFMRRYRIYEAAERVARHEQIDWAGLAADLGYADQSHLTRDFAAAVGEPPARYAASR